MKTQTKIKTKQVIRLPEVMNMAGLKRSTLYAFVKAGTFPKPIKLGAHASGWLASEVQNWLDERIELWPFLVPKVERGINLVMQEFLSSGITHRLRMENKKDINFL